MSRTIWNSAPVGLASEVRMALPPEGGYHAASFVRERPALGRASAALLAAAGMFVVLLSPAKLLGDELPGAPLPAPVKREDLPPAFRKDTPSSLDDLKSIEAHVKDLVTRVSPAVVAVLVGGATGSGVVISEDGFVLCAAHVCERPNLRVTFIFPDGKTARGKTLGTNHEIDAGLMKITDPGQWPQVKIGELDETRLGDWVVALGHPGGFDPERSMVVRLGRIIRLGSGLLQTDCTLIGGDSGGPLFDMHGRVVGIHSRISNSTAANFHVPISTYHETWERLAKSENWGDEGPQGPPWIGAWGLDHPGGFRIELVNRGGPAEKAGLKIGDVVMKLHGQDISGHDAFDKIVKRSKPGQEVTLVIKRDNEEISVKVTIGSRPAGS